jgi:putative thioredoxin
MMASDFIIDVTEADFEYQVLVYSQQVPVVVDFWAEWCGPCRVLGPMLEKLAQEAQGDFRLAKVDVDQNQNLAIRYGVRNIPVVKAFRNGEMVSEFFGVQPEARVREFLKAIAPSTSDLLLEKGTSLLGLNQASEAEVAFRQVLDDKPDSPVALLGLTKSLLLQGHSRESHAILSDFPASRETYSAEVLLPLSRALEYQEVRKYYDGDDPQEAAYYNAIRLVKLGNIEAAMDGFLDILRIDKHFKDDEGRRIFVALLELLGENSPLANQYRNEFASIIF